MSDTQRMIETGWGEEEDDWGWLILYGEWSWDLSLGYF